MRDFRLTLEPESVNFIDCDIVECLAFERMLKKVRKKNHELRELLSLYGVTGGSTFFFGELLLYLEDACSCIWSL